MNDNLNVIVGNNECGKSTLLEAVHLALSGQLNGRPLVVEMHPYLFNLDLVRKYIDSLAAGEKPHPPHILLEVYLADDPNLTKLKGDHNSLKIDRPGVSLSIELNPSHAEDFIQYVSDPAEIRTVPIEYYRIVWRNFAGNDIAHSRDIPQGVTRKPGATG